MQKEHLPAWKSVTGKRQMARIIQKQHHDPLHPGTIGLGNSFLEIRKEGELKWWNPVSSSMRQKMKGLKWRQTVSWNVSTKSLGKRFSQLGKNRCVPDVDLSKTLCLCRQHPNIARVLSIWWARILSQMLLYKPIFHYCSEFTIARRRWECLWIERELLLLEDL